MRTILLVAVFLLCAGMAGLRAEPMLIDGVAAHANSHVITLSDVLGSSRELQQALAQRQSGDVINALYRDVLDELINRKLILDAYEDQKEIKIPEGMVDERVHEIIREMFGDNRVAFLNALAEEGQSEQAWREQIREQMVVAAMRNLRVARHVNISPVAVRDHYERYADIYTEPAQVKFSMIVIGKGEDTGSQERQTPKFQAVLGSLEAGSSFADVARRYSEGVRAAEGGQRDWMDPELLQEDLREMVMTLAPGTVSEVIDMGGHYAIVRVDDRRKAVPLPFDEVYARIERELQIEKSSQIYEDWIERLRHDGYVRIINEKPF